MEEKIDLLKLEKDEEGQQKETCRKGPNVSSPMVTPEYWEKRAASGSVYSGGKSKALAGKVIRKMNLKTKNRNVPY